MRGTQVLGSQTLANVIGSALPGGFGRTPCHGRRKKNWRRPFGRRQAEGGEEGLGLHAAEGGVPAVEVLSDPAPAAGEATRDRGDRTRDWSGEHAHRSERAA
jgi:hypothetical protein